MVLYHYSPKPFKYDKDKKYNITKDRMKPYGLWLSDDRQEENWYTWCLTNDFRLKNLKYRTDIWVDTEDKFLYLTTDGDVMKFHNKYSNGEVMGLTDKMVDWTKVKKDYKGIVISPYQWSLRMDLFWYYGWDCASGVVWDLGCIKNVGKSEKVKSEVK